MLWLEWWVRAVVNKIELDGCNLFSIPKLTLPSWVGIIWASLGEDAICWLFYFLLYLFSFIFLCTAHFSNFISYEIVLMLKESRIVRAEEAFNLCGQCSNGNCSSSSSSYTYMWCMCLPISVILNCISNIVRHILPDITTIKQNQNNNERTSHPWTVAHLSHLSQINLKWSAYTAHHLQCHSDGSRMMTMLVWLAIWCHHASGLVSYKTSERASECILWIFRP